MYKTIFILLFTTISTTVFAQSLEEKQDSLLTMLKASKEDTTKAQVYNSMAMLHAFSQPKVSIDYARKGLMLSRKHDYYRGMEVAYGYIFNGHYYYGSHSDSLLKYIELSEKHVQAANREEDMVTVFWNYAIYYGRLNQTDKEIEAFINALNLVRKYNKSKNKEAELLCNVGVAMSRNANYTEALKYYNEGLSLIKGNVSKANILYNMAMIYTDYLEQEDTGKVLYEKAYQFYKKGNSYAGMADILIVKAKLQDNEGNYQEANRLYQEALKMIEDNEIGYLLMTIYEAFSGHYLKQKQFQKAIEYGEKAIAVVEEQDDYSFLNVIYKTLGAAYVGLGDYKKAYEIRGLIIEYKDSINSVALKNKVEELETVFSVEQKEQENELLKAQQKASQRKNLAITIALLSGLLLAVGWGIMSYRSQRQKQRYNQELEAKNKELQALDETKTRFFANISHEYKTPLTLIMNPIRKVLSRNELKEEDRFLIKSAEKNSLQLFDLTKQVLELTKFEVNKTNYHPINFNLHKALKKTFADFQSAALSRNIDFQLQFDGDEALVLFIDYFKFSTILKNLITNALKFTPDNGQVKIEATTDKQNVIVKVTDNGRGIHNDDLPHIFDRYYQAKNTAIIQEGGTGIGLAICNEFVKIMNGQISVESQYGKGSQFTVHIPIVTNSEASSTLFEFATPKPVTTTPISTPKTPNEQLPNILLVEDNLDMQEYIRFTLQEFYNVSVVPNGKVALRFLEENYQDIHLIISDLMMPEMNGYELVQQLKQTPQYAAIPTIMLTAINTKDDKLKALRIGIDDYLTKPFEDEELMARIDNLIQNAEERKTYQAIETTENNGKSPAQTTANTTNKPVNQLSKKDLEWLKKLEKVVKKHCSNSNLKIDFIASEMAVSETSAFRKIKKLTGLTPKKYIDEIRFQIARELLETGKNYTIKAVAMNVGYKDEKNFARNFKKRFGKYPSVYLE